MNRYLKFLKIIKTLADTHELTNLVYLTTWAEINHNASTMLLGPYLNVVRKRKSDGTYKWIGKKPSKKMANELLEITNFYTQNRNFKKVKK